jgi:hypothetical protein
MSLADNKIASFEKRISDLPDRPSPTYSATDIKGYFDSSPEELRVALNGIIDDLLSTIAGTSGAEAVGSAPISGLTGTSVYAQLVALEAQIQALVGGVLPPGVVTSAMLQDGAVTHVKLSPGEQTASVGGLLAAYQTLGGF